MELEAILLKKEEIEIFEKTGFYVPIHPSLLDKSAKIDPALAKKVFPQAASEWYQDLKQAVEGIQDAQESKWIRETFLKEEPRIEVAYPNTPYAEQRLASVQWKDNMITDENGFARSLEINRNYGGTLYLSPNPMYISTPFIRFSREKFSEYSYGAPTSVATDHGHAHVYLQHNVDHFPGALFLRNWAIIYLNGALKQIAKPV
jgi:hypothetical protein